MSETVTSTGDKIVSVEALNILHVYNENTYLTKDDMGNLVVVVTENNTSDATATAEDIALDKTAYVNGEKITGTHECSSESGTSSVELPKRTHIITQGTATSIKLSSLAAGIFDDDITWDTTTTYEYVTISETGVDENGFSYAIVDISADAPIGAISIKCIGNTTGFVSYCTIVVNGTENVTSMDNITLAVNFSSWTVPDQNAETINKVYTDISYMTAMDALRNGWSYSVDDPNEDTDAQIHTYSSGSSVGDILGRKYLVGTGWRAYYEAAGRDVSGGSSYENAEYCWKYTVTRDGAILDDTDYIEPYVYPIQDGDIITFSIVTRASMGMLQNGIFGS